MINNRSQHTWDVNYCLCEVKEHSYSMRLYKKLHALNDVAQWLLVITSYHYNDFSPQLQLILHKIINNINRI